MSNTLYDSLRQLPPATIEPNNLIGVSHRGKLVVVSTNIRVPGAVFQAGDMVGVLNDSGTPITIQEGPELTLKLENSAGPSTGNRTLAAYAQASIWFQTPTIAWIVGGGVS